MKYQKTTLSKISNTLFLIISIFLFFYIWSVNTIKNINTSIIVSTIITTVFSGIILYFTIKKEKNIKNIKNNNIILDKCALNLYLGSNEKIISFFKSIFTEYKNIDNVFYNKNDIKILLFNKENISLDDIVPYIKQYSTKVTFLTINYDKTILPYLKSHNIEISILELKDIIMLYFSPLNKYPDFNIEKNKKPNLKFILKDVFSIKRAKPYFITSIIILLYSLYLPHKILYVVLSSTLLLLCIISLLIKTKNT